MCSGSPVDADAEDMLYVRLSQENEEVLMLAVFYTSHLSHQLWIDAWGGAEETTQLLIEQMGSLAHKAHGKFVEISILYKIVAVCGKSRAPSCRRSLTCVAGITCRGVAEAGTSVCVVQWHYTYSKELMRTDA